MMQLNSRGPSAGPCSMWLLLLFLCLTVGLSQANFDLYLQKPEVKRTLGLDAELYYVREGVLNDYALTYRVLVGADIHSLYFTWKATARNPVLYNVGIFVNETEGSGGGTGRARTLATPLLNISLSGVIPVSESTFRMDLPCTGLTSAEVAVVLNINVTAPRPSRPPTELYIVRRKVCLRGQSGEILEKPRSSVEEESAREDPLPPLYYVISVLAALTLVIAIVSIVAAFRNRRINNKRHHIITSDLGMGVYECMRSESGSLLQQSEQHPGSLKWTTDTYVAKTDSSYASLTPGKFKYPAESSIAASYNTIPYQNGNFTCERKVLQNLGRDGGSMASSRGLLQNLNREGSSRATTRSSSSLLQKQSRDTDSSRTTTPSSNFLNKPELLLDPSIAHFKERLTHCEIPRDRVKVAELVQEGGFGKVYRGFILRNIPGNDQPVIIKGVSSLAPTGEVVSLYKEGLQLFNLHHRNILSVMGISHDDNSPPFLIYPHHDCQNLKLYLLSQRSGGQHLVAGELLELSVQAAHALAFLHQANLSHGDVAARNCRVSSSFQLLVCDSALSRNLFPEDYEAEPPGTSSRPIKWMAYEAITDHIISSHSDMWSYGVLLWELTSLAQQPYVEVTRPCEMPDYLRDGYRLVQPQNCPDDLYKVMAFCWAIHPSERPHVNLILDYLADFSKQLNNFV